MTQFEKTLLFALADIAASQFSQNHTPEQIINYWMARANKLWPRTTEKGEKAPTIPQEDIDSVYRAYPTKDPNNNDRRIAKSAKDKEKIRRLLENGHTKEELLDLIQKTKEDGRWLKDFSTWLNNLPDFSDPQPEPQPKKKEEYRLRW